MKKLPYGFKRGAPKAKGNYLCYALTGAHSSNPYSAGSPNEVTRGFWTEGREYGYLMKDNGWIGWIGSECLMHHPIPVNLKWPITGEFWLECLEKNLTKMGHKVIRLGYKIV